MGRERCNITGGAVLAVAGLLSCTVAPAAQLSEAAGQGNAEFTSHCASCHGAVLEGGQHAPPLLGPGFQANWTGKPARSLYSRIISTMPQDSPGTLTPAQALSITLFVFSMNDISLGEKSIATANDLNSLTIAARASAP